MAGETKTCPNCGEDRLAEILYGMPIMDSELERALEAGKIVLGGCVVTDHDPFWQCLNCQARFYEDMTPANFSD